jgi:hypothetical protein
MQVAETPWICIAAVDAMSFIFNRRGDSQAGKSVAQTSIYGAWRDGDRKGSLGTRLRR